MFLELIFLQTFNNYQARVRFVVSALQTLSSFQIPHLCFYLGTGLCVWVFFLPLLGFALTCQCVNRTPHHSFVRSVGVIHFWETKNYRSIDNHGSFFFLNKCLPLSSCRLSIQIVKVVCFWLLFVCITTGNLFQVV